MGERPPSSANHTDERTDRAKEKGSPTMLFLAVVAAAIASLVQARHRRWFRWGSQGASGRLSCPWQTSSTETSQTEKSGRQTLTSSGGPAVSRDFFAANVRGERTLKLFAREAHRNASWPRIWQLHDRRYSPRHTSRGYFEVKSRSEVHQYPARSGSTRMMGRVRGQRLTCREYREKRAPRRARDEHDHDVYPYARLWAGRGSTRGHLKVRLHFGDRVGKKRKSKFVEKRESNPAPLGPACHGDWRTASLHGLEWNDTSIVTADGNQVGDAYDAVASRRNWWLW